MAFSVHSTLAAANSFANAPLRSQLPGLRLSVSLEQMQNNSHTRNTELHIQLPKNTRMRMMMMIDQPMWPHCQATSRTSQNLSKHPAKKSSITRYSCRTRCRGSKGASSMDRLIEDLAALPHGLQSSNKKCWPSAALRLLTLCGVSGGLSTLNLLGRDTEKCASCQGVDALRRHCHRPRVSPSCTRALLGPEEEEGNTSHTLY